MAINRLDLDSKAYDCRRKLGIDTDAPIDIFSVVTEEISELTLVLYPFGNNISGMFMSSDGVQCIAINSNMPYGRQRFTLCHELYHYYFDDNSALIQLCSMKLDPKDENERKADTFASFLLAPYHSLTKKFHDLCADKPTLENIIRLEQFFGISHTALLWRLKIDNLINEEQLKEFDISSISLEAQKLGFTKQLYYPFEEKGVKKTLGAYIRNANNIFEKGLISQGKFEELLIQAYRTDLVYGNLEKISKENELA